MTAVETMAGVPLPDDGSQTLDAFFDWRRALFIGGPIAEARRLKQQPGGLIRLHVLGRPFAVDQHGCAEFIVGFLEDVALGTRLCQVIGSEGPAHNRSASSDLGNAQKVAKLGSMTPNNLYLLWVMVYRLIGCRLLRGRLVRTA